MKSHRVDQIKNYLSPDSPSWSRVPTAQIGLMPTPLQMQPTEYIRASWDGKKYGETPKLEVASVHDGEMWALRATWQGSGPRPTDSVDPVAVFQDAFAIALPVRNNPVLALMGSKDAPIHYLRWSADKKEVNSMIATGIGQSLPGPELKRSVQAQMQGSTWHIVIARALSGSKEVAQLAAGKKTAVGFALWRGSNEERAGIKAFSIDWTELALDV